MIASIGADDCKPLQLLLHFLTVTRMSISMYIRKVDLLVVSLGAAYLSAWSRSPAWGRG
jgi:hypothetical protein